MQPVVGIHQRHTISRLNSKKHTYINMKAYVSIILNWQKQNKHQTTFNSCPLS